MPGAQLAAAVVADPIYLDWKFWSVVVSLTALVLSQLPPLHILVRRARITIECYSHMVILHRYGNPNAQLHVILANTGGRKVRITGLSLQLKGATGQPFTLPAANYLQEQGDKDSVLFTPFSLKPGDEWAHIVNFFPQITRQDDKLLRQSIAALRDDIAAKRRGLEDKAQDVKAEAVLVAPFTELFTRQFKWLPDDYEMTVSVVTEPPGAMAGQQFRMVVFESDTEQLRSSVPGYDFGYGIICDPQAHDVVLIPLQKVKQGD